jgi:flagella basal body P-ring formation protein FlgA
MKRTAHFKPLALICLACAWLLSLAAPALAQELVASTDVMTLTQRWLDAAVRQPTSDAHALRLEVSLGNLDARLRLAPCAEIEPYLPVNTSLWGKTRVGLRCLKGTSHWNVFLPVTIKAFGPAWVLRGAIAPGSTIRQEDAMAAEVDWANEASPIVRDAAQWVGKVAAYSLSAGQPLRQAMIRPAQAFQAGASIRVLAQGQGFSVSSDGQALSPGIVGQLARVRTEGGKVVSGTVLDTHTVEIAL